MANKSAMYRKRTVPNFAEDNDSGDRTRTLSLAIMLLLSLGLSACTDDSGDPCGAGLVCPENSVCAARQNICIFTACGNGVIDAIQNEECDDGNVIGGDGCSPFCLIESDDGGLSPDDGGLSPDDGGLSLDDGGSPRNDGGQNPDSGLEDGGGFTPDGGISTPDSGAPDGGGPSGCTEDCPSQPNIVLILADDLGINEVGVYGQLQRELDGLPSIDTPNIDSLARAGLRFTNMYAPATVCAPTRASLLTGFHGGHASVDSNGLNNNGANAFRDVDYTLAQMLKEVGYTTATYGKWGQNGMDGTKLSPVARSTRALSSYENPVVTDPQTTPSSKGFDEFYGYLNHIHAHTYYTNYLWEHDTDGSGDLGGMQVDWSPNPSNYTHDLIARKSIEFIRRHAQDRAPFFMYGAFTLPHNDYNPPEDMLYMNYLNRAYTEEQARYAAMVSRLDRTVGAIVTALDDPNNDGDTSDSVLNQTLIIFATDNGPANPAANRWFDGNGIYRGLKNSVYEGAHRSPFIVHWPDQIKPINPDGDINSSHIGTLTDLFATFADIAKTTPPVGLDSTSMAHLMGGGSSVSAPKFIVWEDRPSDDWAIRMGDYKLVKAGPLQLYNLVSDPSERNDLLVDGSEAHLTLASRMWQIAIEEGVESDAGLNGAQNTHIVQYKTWNPSGSSTAWNIPANWAGGSEFNTRGTPANNFSTTPQNNWIVNITNNVSSAPQTVRIEDTTEVLGLEIMGTTGPMNLSLGPQASLLTRNGARALESGRISIEGGTLATLRTIEVQENAELRGFGLIDGRYGFSAIVQNNGLLSIGHVDIPLGRPGPDRSINYIRNSSFELGADADGDRRFAYAELDAWSTNHTDTSLDGALPNTSYLGTYRGLVSNRSQGEVVNLMQRTEYIADGRPVELSFRHRSFAGWDDTDALVATLYYQDESMGNQRLGSIDVQPSSSWTKTTLALDAATTQSVLGQPIYVDFSPVQSGLASNEFASIDAIELYTIVEGNSGILIINGDYIQQPLGEIQVNLAGPNGIAGVDYTQLRVSGRFSVLGGTLSVRLDETYTPAAGDTFRIFDLTTAVTGDFDAVSLPPLGASLTWDLSELLTQGILRVRN